MRNPKVFNGQGCLVQQHFKEAADMNQIMAKYYKTGQLTDPRLSNGRMPQFGDFRGVDFRENQNKIAKIKEAFMAFPAGIRNRFQNDPSQMLDFIENPANEAECISMGIKPPKVAVPPEPSLDVKGGTDTTGGGV